MHKESLVVLAFLWVAICFRAGIPKIISVVPAKAGIHSELDRVNHLWVPAFAGMTEGILTSIYITIGPRNTRMNRKCYTSQNKSIAVGLVYAGESVAAVTQNLKVPRQTLLCWVKLESRSRLPCSAIDSQNNHCDQ